MLMHQHTHLFKSMFLRSLPPTRMRHFKLKG